MKFFYRCSKCRSRLSVTKILGARRKVCSCGNDKWYTDGHRAKEYKSRKGVYARCRCDGAPYTHRPGSVPLCESASAEKRAKFILEQEKERYG